MVNTRKISGLLSKKMNVSWEWEGEGEGEGWTYLPHVQADDGLQKKISSNKSAYNWNMGDQ